MLDVIVMTHNRPGLLIEAIESLKNQSDTDFRVIVCDDAGPSSSANIQIVSNAQKEGLDITFVRQSKNLGPGAGRNLAVKLSSSDFLCFLDDDDLYTKDSIAIRKELIRSSASALFSHGFEVHGSEYVTDKDSPEVRVHLSECSPWCGRFTISRALFDDVRGFPLSWHSEDSELWRLAAKKVKPIEDTKVALIYRRKFSVLSYGERASGF